MNLIEQLGGYEKAKSKFRDNGSLHAERMKAALLEYRREHGIFEVGDFVLPLSNYSNEVCELTEDYIGLDFKYKTKSGGFGYIVKSFMPTKWRHATDAEITTGRRIKSNNSQAISDCSFSNFDENEKQTGLSIKQDGQP